MSIVGRQPRKSTKTKTTARRKTTRRGSSFKRSNQSWIVRLFSRVPSWLLWLFGLSIAIAYIVFILQIVLHFSMPWKAQYGEVPEPGNYPVRGIDISHYQEDIDWNVLSSATLNGHKLSFIIVKATEGVSISDKYFKNNFKRARKNGYVRGAYHFYIPGRDAKMQADFFISNVKLEKGDLPPVLDIEKHGGMSIQDLQGELLEWLRVVKQHYGVNPIIYTNYAFKIKYLNTKDFDEYPFWIAHYYKDELDYNGPWIMWQYTDCGKVLGITGNVDCNVFNGTRDELDDLCIK